MKRLAALILLLALAIASAMAEEKSFPGLQVSVEYGQIHLPFIEGFTNPSCAFDAFCAGRFVETTGGTHSGLSSQQDLNRNRWLGFENYLGYYSAGRASAAVEHILGRRVPSSFFTDTFGVRFTARASNQQIPVPYAVLGIGGSALTSSGQGSVSGVAARVGGGVEIPIKGSIGLRVDYSRASSHLAGAWRDTTHLSVGASVDLSK